MSIRRATACGPAQARCAQLADNRWHCSDDRGGEPLAQPALGMHVLAGPLPLDREAVRRTGSTRFE